LWTGTWNGMKTIEEHQREMIESERVKEFHKHRKSHLESRTIDPEHFGYMLGHHPLQVCITASGWRAKILKFLFRIPPCNFTGTSVRYWPHDELIK
jgi:hypothetical protein